MQTGPFQHCSAKVQSMTLQMLPRMQQLLHHCHLIAIVRLEVQESEKKIDEYMESKITEESSARQIACKRKQSFDRASDHKQLKTDDAEKTRNNNPPLFSR